MDSHIRRLRSKLDTIPHPGWTITTICSSEGEVTAALLEHATVAGIQDAVHEGIHFLLIALLAAMCIALVASILMSTIFLRPIRSIIINYLITLLFCSQQESVSRCLPRF